MHITSFNNTQLQKPKKAAFTSQNDRIEIVLKDFAEQFDEHTMTKAVVFYLICSLLLDYEFARNAFNQMQCQLRHCIMTYHITLNKMVIQALVCDQVMLNRKILLKKLALLFDYV